MKMTKLQKTLHPIAGVIVILSVISCVRIPDVIHDLGIREREVGPGVSGTAISDEAS